MSARSITAILLWVVAVGVVGGTAVPGAHPVEATPGGGTGNGNAPAASAAAQEAACDYDDLYEATIPSVVTVRVSNESGEFAQGSGWVYDDGLVVTNWHVVADGTGFDVQFSNGEWRTAEVVGVDVRSDLAVLAVEDLPADADPLPVADSLPNQGEEVAALGSPLGLEGTISRGVVSGVNRAVTVQYSEGFNQTIPLAIQTDAAIAPGSSGGPLVNCTGEVVGVNYAGDRFVDINFAISASMVRRVVPALIENGTYRHSFLGVAGMDVSPTLARVNEVNVTSGVLVVDVLPDGPSDGALEGSPAIHRRTGLPVGGDVIVAMDGTPIESQGDLLAFLFEETRPGETVEVTVIRDGERQTVEVTLGERPSFQPEPTTPEPTPEEPTPTPEETPETTEEGTATPTTSAPVG